MTLVDCLATATASATTSDRSVRLHHSSTVTTVGQCEHAWAAAQMVHCETTL